MTSSTGVTVAAFAGLILALPSFAATESVRVTKAMDDKAIVSRRSGESYLIEKGTGCLSLWRYEGKSVLIVSPGLFLGVGSRLFIPELDQECRIWNSELLSDSLSAPRPRLPASSTPPASPKPATPDRGGIATIQKALRLAGYDPGPADGTLGPATTAALDKYRASKGHPLTEEGLRKTFIALALDVVSRNPSNEGALQVSMDLISFASQPPQRTAIPSSPDVGNASPGCEDGHWIESVSSDGEIVKLEDGSIWEISAIDQIDTTLWLPTEEITVCGDRLINTDTGDAVDATRLR